MLAGAAFDLYVGQFTAGEVAQVCGVSRPVIDMWGARGLLRPTRRERPTSRPSAGPKGKRAKPSKGRPLFSARDIFKALLMRVLAEQVGLGLSESVDVAHKAENRKITEAEAAKGALAELAEIADTPAMEGEWMWAVARSVERQKPLYIYAYVRRAEHTWQFDMHLGNPGERPCFTSFGWDVPHIFIPISNIFIVVYIACKKLLGIETTSKS